MSLEKTSMVAKYLELKTENHELKADRDLKADEYKHELKRLNDELEILKINDENKTKFIRHCYDILKTNHLDSLISHEINELDEITNGVIRVNKPPTFESRIGRNDDEQQSCPNPADETGLVTLSLYPPRIYDDIPFRGPFRRGPNCSCLCRHYGRWMCRARNFKNPMDGPSMTLNHIVNLYNICNSHEFSFVNLIERNMTKQYAKHLFNMCKACNCCDRHKENFPLSFGNVNSF